MDELDERRWLCDEDDLTAALASLSETARAGLARLVQAGGELALAELEADERLALAELAEGFEPLRLIEPILATLAPEAFSLIAAAVAGVPRRPPPTPGSRHSPPPQTPPPPPVAASAALRWLADAGGLELLARASKTDREALREAASSPWGRSCLRSLGGPGPVADLALGPCLALRPEALAGLRSAPRVARWTAGPPVLIALEGLRGLARRGELERRRDGRLPKRLLDRLGVAEPQAPGFPAPPLASLLPEAALAAEREDGAGGDDWAPTVAGLGAALDLDVAWPGLTALTAEAWSLALSGGAQDLARAADEALLGALEAAGEELAEWSYEDLRGTLWPRVAPLLALLGLVEIGWDALGAPVALRPAPWIRGDGRPRLRLARRRGAALEIEVSGDAPALSWLRAAARAGPLRPEGEGWRWELADLAALGGLAEGCELDADLSAALAEARRPRPKARLRSWAVLELSRAADADALAADPLFAGILVDRVTPTVWLLTGREALTPERAARLRELGLDLDGAP